MVSLLFFYMYNCQLPISISGYHCTLHIESKRLDACSFGVWVIGFFQTGKIIFIEIRV